MKNLAAAAPGQNLFEQMLSPFQQAMELIHSHLCLVEERICQQSCLFDPAIEGYISYVAAKGGKRLRPTLALLAGGATGDVTAEHVDLAVIMELIHIATLVHDDIIDGAELRRDQLTANAKWGNALSVLLGDCLFAHALRLSTSFPNQEIGRKIADASAEVCSGEIIQIQRRFDVKLSVADYYRIIEMKTAALFAVACELGALLSKADQEAIAALRQFGHRLGIAYQIYDDCLDLVGDEAQAGKTLGTDLRKGKFTLPILLLLHQQGVEPDQSIYSLFEQDTVDVEKVIRMVGASTAMQAASQTGLQWVAEARGYLTKLPKNQHVKALDAVASHLEMLLSSLEPIPKAEWTA